MRVNHSLLGLLFAATALADCECGYTVNTTTDSHYALFTDLFETDFLHVSDVTFNGSYSTGWIPQDYDTPGSESTGSYGMAKQDSNLVPNYISDPHDYSGPGVLGDNTGLQLWVRNNLLHSSGSGKLVPSAEIVSERDDILYGSFRVAMKSSSVNGTCAAFYFYRNDTQELDVEILSAEQFGGKKEWPVHLVTQNTTADPKDDGSGGSKQLLYRLPSPPSETYNEYRFDWLPGRVEYYVNGQMAWSTTENVPSTAGRIHISHWSDGNPYWSRGPPVEDAVMTVSYVKAYFNSTNTTRNHQYHSSCLPRSVYLLGRTCEIPTQHVAPNLTPVGPDGNATGRTYFFTHDADMVPGQTVYESSAINLSLLSVRNVLIMFAVSVSVGLAFLFSL